MAPEASLFEAGLRTLWQYNGRDPVQKEIDDAVERALQVKVARESDAFAYLGSPRFEVEGLEHLQKVMGQNRPIILLTGHVGNFYALSVALAQVGIVASSLARSVAPSNSYPRRSFERINYFLSEHRMRGGWIYANYAGKLDRQLVTMCRNGGMLVVLLDLPRALFGAGRRPVRFMGRTSSLPARTVELGQKYKAVFLTAWNTIEPEKDFLFRRCLRIEPPFPDDDDVDGILQAFADRLSSLVIVEPWQWSGVPIINQFDESRFKCTPN
ncbi:MAG: hypothetical protein NTW42_07910 [Deltaproteobacteria bacterium]|nr:hypothetical protein [Deltaproteobacteria bacterium]